MGTKMKGLLKGLRYISQIFDEEKELEIQIGFPTDVKHVAHIGWDGPSSAVDNSPSWMKEFKPGGAQSAPLDASGNPIENREDKWDSSSQKKLNSPAGDLAELPKSSRRHSAAETSDSPNKEPSTKSRSSRRHQRKDSGGGSCRSGRRTQDQSSNVGPEATKLPDVPNKARRKKLKDGVSTRSKCKDSSVDGGSMRASRSQANNIPPAYTGPYSDPGPGADNSITGEKGNNGGVE